MASVTEEKHRGAQHSADLIDDHHDVKKQEVITTKTAMGAEAFQQAMLKEPPKWFSAPVLIPAIMVAYCCSTANGYDGSLFGALLASTKFKNFFSVENDGIGAGKWEQSSHCPPRIGWPSLSVTSSL